MSISTLHSRWYQEPFVWVLIIIPFTAVVMGFLILYYSITSKDGLVDNDYYQDGLQINEVLDRDAAARKYGLDAQMKVDYKNEAVAVKLAARSLTTLPPVIQVTWMYATHSGFDQKTELDGGVHGNYQGRLPKLPPGHWYVQMEAGDWRLLGSLYVPQDSTIHLPESLRTANVDIRVH